MEKRKGKVIYHLFNPDFGFSFFKDNGQEIETRDSLECWVALSIPKGAEWFVDIYISPVIGRCMSFYDIRGEDGRLKEIAYYEEVNEKLEVYERISIGPVLKFLERKGYKVKRIELNFR